MFVLQIRKAAHETKDTLFTFGAGQDVRQCAFKFAFLKFMEDLQVSEVIITPPQFLSRLLLHESFFCGGGEGVIPPSRLP